MANTVKFPQYFEPLTKQPTEAVRIWAADCEREIDQYVMFRKSFTVSENGVYQLRIFGDTYYNLYIDGKFLHRGPVRRHELHAEFDCLDLALEHGQHTIAVLVHWLGQKCAGHRMAASALWCDILKDGMVIAKTDAEWRAMFCGAFLTDGCIMSHYDYREDIDMRCYPYGWEKPGFDDSAWKSAVVLGGVGDETDLHKDYTTRRMQLFVYHMEDAVLTRSGTWAERKDPTEPFVWRCVERARDTEKRDGNYTVAQFRSVFSGTPVITYENALDGDEILIGYDDMTDENGIPMPGRAMGYVDRFTVSAGNGTLSVQFPRGFRYLLIDTTGNCRITGVSSVMEAYPYTERKSFVSGDPYFTELYEQSANTQRVCTIDGFTDCVGRERVLWLGDAYLDCLGAYYADADRGLLLTTIYEHAMGQGDCGALGGYNSSDMQPEWLFIPSYNMMFLHMMCDYILYTGKEEDLLPLLPTARRILDFILDNCNARGIFDTTCKDCSNYWDWGYEEPEGESLKTNAYFVYTVERMAGMPFFASIIDDDLLARCRDMKEKCGAIFYDAARGVYHDGNRFGGLCNPLATQGANAYAVISGICPEHLRRKVLTTITDAANLDEVPCGEIGGAPDTDKVLPAGTMYGAAMVTRALFENGLYDRAIDYMREVWGPFAGMPTLPELRRNGKSHTMCHGWSGAPAFLLHMYVLGLTPRTNGWKEAQLIPPETAQIPYAKGVVHTPLGDVSAQWYRYNGVLQIHAEIPDGMTLYVIWQGREYPLSAGMKTLYISD